MVIVGVMNKNQEFQTEGNVGTNAPWWIFVVFVHSVSLYLFFQNLNFFSCKELISCNLGRYSDWDLPQHSFLHAMVIDSGMGTYFKLAAKVFPRTFFLGYQEKQNH